MAPPCSSCPERFESALGAVRPSGKAELSTPMCILIRRFWPLTTAAPHFKLWEQVGPILSELYMSIFGAAGRAATDDWLRLRKLVEKLVPL